MIYTSTYNILGYNVFGNQLNSIGSHGQLTINTINPHSYVVAKKDRVFREALQQSDILLPDGIGIVLANSLINKSRIKKIAGSDIHIHMLTELNKNGGKCFYMGASEATLTKIKERLTRDFPMVQTGFYSPPYKNEFSIEENDIILDAINAFEPDVLFVGMTAPKQEKWVHLNKKRINASVICSIGAVFDFYAGTIKRPHKFWIRIGLEFLPRFFKEPKRLWQRNLISTPYFLFCLLKYYFKKSIFGK